MLLAQRNKLMYSFVILYPSHWLDKYDKKRCLDRDIRLSVVFPFSMGSELLTSDFIYIPFLYLSNYMVDNNEMVAAILVNCSS